MAWSKDAYPEPMKDLQEDVRSRAIDIANQLLEEGMDEAGAVSTAMDRAMAWAAHRGMPAEVNRKYRNTGNSSRNP